MTLPRKQQKKTAEKPIDRSVESSEAYDKPIRQWALGFEQYLQKADAAGESALHCLIKAGCNKVVIIELLNGVCVQVNNSVNLRREARGVRKQAQRLVRDLNSLSNNLRSFHRVGVIDLIREWDVPLLPDSDEEPAVSSKFVENLPSLLSAYAALLEVTWCDEDFLQPFKEDSIELLLLASYVRCYARHPHYADLSALLDAADCYEKDITMEVEPRSPDALRNEINRFRKRHLEYARELDRLVREYKEQYEARYPGSHFLNWIYPRQVEVPLRSEEEP